MKYNYKRSERVGELIREEVANIIAKELKDPRLGFVTVTGIDISNDLRNMNVFVSVLGEEEDKKQTVKALESSTGFIKKTIGKRLYLKRIPSITFKMDNSLEYGDKMSKLLDSLKKNEET